MTKIAQYPSAADLAVGDILKYEKILGDDAKEFSRALGLFAHGIGIGSFVYLRRIVEKLVEEAHVIAKEQIDWKEEAYASARFSEKVEKLGHLLPTFLCENSSIYSLISRGIHQLTERECLDAFPVLKTSIELILDERLAAIERSEKIEQTKAALAKLKQQHPQAKGGQR